MVPSWWWAPSTLCPRQLGGRVRESAASLETEILNEHQNILWRQKSNERHNLLNFPLFIIIHVNQIYFVTF